jgi:phospholipid/cholesterol/gamma-HCH transport system permease protein
MKKIYSIVALSVILISCSNQQEKTQTETNSPVIIGAEYIEGLQTDFNPFLLTYAMIKTLIFAFLIATVPSYHGYYVKGGSIAVGRASTQAVVWTTILIVIANYFLTQMLLT